LSKVYWLISPISCLFDSKSPLEKESLNRFGWCETAGNGLNAWGFCSFSCSLDVKDETDLMLIKMWALSDCRRLSSVAKDMDVEREFCYSGVVNSQKFYIFK